MADMTSTPVTFEAVRALIADNLGEFAPALIALAINTADVLANIRLVVSHFGIDEARMHRRIAAKLAHLRAWHAMDDDSEFD